VRCRSGPAWAAGRRRLTTPTGHAGPGLPGRRLFRLVTFGPAHLPPRPEQVVDEEHTDEVVEVVAADREAAVARLAHRPGHRIDGEGDGQGHHVHPGGHHLADHGVVQVVEGVDDELLLGVRTAVGRRDRVDCRAGRPAATASADRRGLLGSDGGGSSSWRRNTDTVVTLSVWRSRQAPAGTGVDTTERGW
jgi:hypothetical protein